MVMDRVEATVTHRTIQDTQKVHILGSLLIVPLNTTDTQAMAMDGQDQVIMEHHIRADTRTQKDLGVVFMLQCLAHMEMDTIQIIIATQVRWYMDVKTLLHVTMIIVLIIIQDVTIVAKTHG